MRSIARLCTFGVIAMIAATGCRKEDGSPGAASSGETAAEDKDLSFAFVSNGIASFWTIAKAGAEAAGEEFGVQVDVRMPAEGTPDQKRIVEDLLARGVDGIAISPIDPTNQMDMMREACERTTVITHDSDAPGSDRLCYVGMDNYAAGRMCGELIKEVMPDGGSVMIFVGRLEQDNARRRRQGVIDELLDRPHNPDAYDAPGPVIEGEHYVILDTRTDQFDSSRGKQNAEDAIASYPDLGCMVGLFAYNPPLMLEALSQAGKLGQIKVVAFDEADETLQGIKEGHVHGTVVQNPYEYGFQSIRILTALARGDKSVIPEGKFVDIPARKIRRDNVETFWNELNTLLKKGIDG